MQWYHWCQYHVRLNGSTWLKKSCCASFQLSCPKESKGVTDDSISEMWCWCWHQWNAWMISHVAPHFNCPDVRNAMVPVMMPVPLAMASPDQKSDVAPHFWSSWPKECIVAIEDASANGITWLKSHVVLHFSHPDLRNTVVPIDHDSTNGVMGEKGHVAPHFNCQDLGNAMVWLSMLSVSYDAEARTSGGTAWLKSHIAPHFDHLDFSRNIVVPLMMLTPVLMVSVTWPKNVSPNFSCLGLRKGSGAGGST